MESEGAIMISDKYAVFGVDGELITRLDSAVNEIPNHAVKVNEELFWRMINEDDGVWTKDGDNIIKMPLPAPTAEEVQADINAEARAYLAKTDWYVTRMHETGQPVPDDIVAARQAARDRVVE